MNTLDRDIMRSLITPQRSMYELQQYLRNYPYATLRRHVKKLRKEGLIEAEEVKRKNGKRDQRMGEKLRLSHLGLATLVLTIELNSDELKEAGARFLKEFSFSSDIRYFGVRIEDVLQELFKRIRPKINLDRRYFDRQHFDKTFTLSAFEYLIDHIKKTQGKKVPVKGRLRQEGFKIVRTIVARDRVWLENLQKDLITERKKFSEYIFIVQLLLRQLKEKR